MALTATQILDAIAPAFKTHPDKAVFLEMATESLSASWWGSRYPRAVALLAAHQLTLTTRMGGTGEAGPISSKSQGSLSVSFGSVGGSSADADLSQTSFGLQLIALRKGQGPFIGVTGQANTLPAVMLPGDGV